MDGEAVFKLICDRVPEAMSRLNVPGVSVGVYSDGARVWRKLRRDQRAQSAAGQ